MKVVYSPHFRNDAQGHIYLDKPGACTVNLSGSNAMSQAELDFYAGIMAQALKDMTPEQQRQAKTFRVRQRVA